RLSKMEWVSLRVLLLLLLAHRAARRLYWSIPKELRDHIAKRAWVLIDKRESSSNGTHMFVSLLDTSVNKVQLTFLEITFELVNVPMLLVYCLCKQAGELVRKVVGHG
nr:hypothetical protein [Tanacetum cinerariifolium]